MSTHEETVSALLQDWKKKPDLLITLEMLKSSLKPLVDLQLDKYDFRKLGVRSANVREAADEIVVEALRTYDDSKGDLNSWVLAALKGLDKVVEELQSKYEEIRKAE
jgi:hypothetical protein